MVRHGWKETADPEWSGSLSSHSYILPPTFPLVMLLLVDAKTMGRKLSVISR